MAKQRTRLSFSWRSLPWLLGACASGTLGACASGTPGSSAPPAEYAPLPQVAPKPEFNVAADLEAIQIACLPEESPQPNGVDDNCDGVIDDTKTASVLSAAIAYPRRASEVIRLWASPEGVSSSHPSEPQDTALEGASVQVRRLDVDSLPAGRYTVYLTREAYAEAGPALPISLSLATPRGTQAYVVSLGAGETRPLGSISAD